MKSETVLDELFFKRIVPEQSELYKPQLEKLWWLKVEKFIENDRGLNIRK